MERTAREINTYDKRFKAELWLQIAFGAVLFLYVAVRAQTLSFTFDESWTYLQFAGGSVLDIVLYRAPISNNHLINTLLVKLFAALFGAGDLVIRMPNVLAFAVYLVFVIRLTRLICPKGLRFLSTVVLLANPFILDFFSLARGYGLAMAFTAAAFFYFHRWINERRLSDLIKLQTAGILAVLSNFTWINLELILVFMVFLLALADKNNTPDLRKELILIFLPPLLLLSYYIPIIKHLNLYILINFGGNAGLWKDSVFCLVDRTLYDITDRGPFITALEALVIFLLTLSLILLAPGRNPEKQKGLWIALVVLLMSGYSFIAQNLILKIPYPTYRVTTFFFLPFGLFFIQLSVLLYDLRKASAFILMAPVAGAALLNVLVNINLDHSREWQYGQDVKQALTDLGDYQKKNHIDERQSLHLYWGYEPAAMFYFKTKHLANLKEVAETYVEPGFDYFYFNDEEYTKYKTLPHELIRHYPQTNSYLIRNLDKLECVEKMARPLHNPMKQGDFNCTLIFRTDSFQTKNLAVETWGTVNFDHEPKDGTIIISLLNEKDSILEYHSWPMTKQLFKPNAWEITYNRANFFDVKEGSKIAIYFYNPGNTEYSVRELKARVYPLKEEWVSVLKN